VSVIEREVKRRNALFRAWVAHGVQVNGRWEVLVDGMTGRVGFRLTLGCALAECHGSKYTWGGDRWGWTDPAALASFEAEKLRRSSTREHIGGCPHLAPLLQPPPPEVEALVPLMLLENPGL
jgi:hypothetical protein